MTILYDRKMNKTICYFILAF